MSRFIPSSFPRISSGLFLLGLALVCDDARADVSYDVRAQTNNKINATIYVPNVGYTIGKVRQGSFGAPSINDKGTVAYACVLAGKGLSTLTNNSVVVRLKGKKPAVVAVQADITVPDTFLPFVSPPSFAVSGSGRMYHISRDVALNNENRVAFAGQLLYVFETPGMPPSFTDAETAVYGLAVPTTKKAKAFGNVGLVSFVNYYDGILTETLSLNSQSSVVFNGNFYITSTRSVPGFGFSSPTNGGVIATTESAVIGLPYFTTFQSFSEPIIADHNVSYVVADISDDGDEFDGIWQGNNPDLQPVVVKNTDAPSGGQFLTFGGKVGASRNGKLCAFTASISGTASGGVYRIERKGTNGMRIAALGESAPSNSESGSAGKFTQFDLAAANNAGQVAFQATVSGNSKSGIWLSDNNGENLQLIVLEGQTLTVGSKEKKITKIAFSPVSGLNSKGQIAFTASFTDRTSAVIVAKL